MASSDSDNILPGWEHQWLAELAPAVLLALCLIGLPLAVPAQDPQALQQKLARAQETEQPAILADLLDAYRNSKPEQALTYGRQALQLLERMPDPSVRVRVLNEMTWALRLLGRNQRALEVGNESLLLAEASGDLSGQGRALNNIGVVYFYLGDYAKVLEYWLKALKIRETLEDQSGVAGSLNNIGLVYFELGENLAAIRQFEQALKISRVTNNREFLVNHLDNLGEVRSRIGEYDVAEKNYQEALSIANQDGNLKGMISVLIDFGALMLQSGHHDRARDYLHQGHELAVQVGVASKQIEAAHLLAQLALQRGQHDQALTILNPALELAGTLTEKVRSRDLFRLLSDIQTARGEHLLALQAYQQFNAINEDLLNQQREDKLTLLQIQFEAEARDRQILLLTQENAIRELDLAQAKTTRRAMQAGIGLLLVLSLVLVLAYRSKIRANLLISKQIEELDANRKILQHLAITDPLTGLFNRRALEKQVDQELARSTRNESSFAMCVVDLDHFKRINDQHGHGMGDQVLIVVGQCIKNALRGQDSVARWGGEEFMLLMPEVGLEEAGVIAERVRSAIAEHSFEQDDTRFMVTATLGVSIYSATGRSVNAVIRAADEALYEGKHAGRNQVVSKEVK